MIVPSQIDIPIPEEEHYPRRTFIFSLLLAVVCLLGFAGGTVAYVTWSVNNSEHKWCSIIDLLNKAPAPAGANASNPSRQYEALLAADFRSLKGSLGC